MVLQNRPTQFNEYDTIIVGGGVFGLSYALAVIEHALPKKVLVIESRRDYHHDRNWCFWLDDDVPSYLSNLISQTYQYTVFDDSKEQFTLSHTDLPYCRLSSDAFYQYALTKIENSDSVDLVMGWQANLNELPQHKLLDARGEWATCLPTNQMTQAFVGLTVRVPNHPYPLNTAIIMGDMRVVEDACAEHFVFDYILPLSKTELLVEVTSFSATAPSVDTLKQWTQLRLSRDFAEYTIVSEEQAYLPMDTKIDHAHNKVGAHSGMMRPATGYAFVQIQRQVSAMLGLYNKVSSFGRMTRFMDGVFLRVIKAQPSLCPTIFMQMVSAMKTQNFIAFMNNRLSPAVWWEVVLSVPKRPFIKSVLR